MEELYCWELQFVLIRQEIGSSRNAKVVIVFWSNSVRRGKRDTEISTPFTSWKNCKDVKETEVTVVGKKQGEEKKELLMPAHQGGL